MSPIRKNKRLTNWDYSSPGSYFVTFCVHDRKCILGKIVEQGPECFAETFIELSDIGLLTASYAKQLELRFPNLKLDSMCIMPNHVHSVMTINQTNDASPVCSIGEIVKFWKRNVTLDARKLGYKGTLWQKGYYEHIIRNESDLIRILEYICNNPKQWKLDGLYTTQS